MAPRGFFVHLRMLDMCAMFHILGTAGFRDWSIDDVTDPFYPNTVSIESMFAI